MSKPTTIEIRKGDNQFVVDPTNLPGCPILGRGRTLQEALGNFLIAYQKELGLTINVHESAQPAEQARRRRELAQR